MKFSRKFSFCFICCAVLTAIHFFFLFALPQKVYQTLYMDCSVCSAKTFVYRRPTHFLGPFLSITDNTLAKYQNGRKKLECHATVRTKSIRLIQTECVCLCVIHSLDRRILKASKKLKYLLDNQILNHFNELFKNTTFSISISLPFGICPDQQTQKNWKSQQLDG